MRTKVLLLCTGLVVGCLASFAFTQGRSQGAEKRDPLKVGPTIYTLVTENDRIRAMHATLGPGEAIEVHDHPDHLSYVLQGGKIEIAPEGGQKQELEIEEGQALWIPAEAHSARNVGDTEIKFLVLELKEPGTRAAPRAGPGGERESR